MSIPAPVLLKLAMLGLDAEKAGIVAAMLSEVETATKAECAGAIEQRRQNDRDRKSRQRRRHVKSRDITGRDVTSGDILPLKERSPKPPKENNPLLTSEPDGSSVDAPSASEDEISPRSELGKVLDAERAAQIVEHRAALGLPLTIGAATKLAAKLSAWRGGAAEAADAMLAHGWRGFEPGWMDRIAAPAAGRPASSAPGPSDRLAIAERRRQQAEKDDREATWHGPMSDEARTKAAQFLGRSQAEAARERERMAGRIGGSGPASGSAARVAAETASKRAMRGQAP